MARVIPVAPLPSAGPSAQVALSVLPPLSLYVHVPWCVRKCPYCDFNSHELRGELPEAAYVAALVADLEAALPGVWGRRIISVFIGGGTPSLMRPEAVDALLAAVRARLPLAPDAEITLEANPGTVDIGRLAGFRAAGVNRLSLGVQSFDARALEEIGRIHDGQQARDAVDAALRHFDNVNIDLIYGLPGQTPADARRDVETAIASGAPHVSAYQLTLEPNTVFHRHPPILPEHDEVADMQALIEDSLGAAGYGQYEIAAFAKPGRRCAHNINYWEFGDYLGIGAGAHGKLSFPDRITRETRAWHPRDYLARTAGLLQSRQEVAATELPVEFMMNALRLVEGWAPALFAARTGLELTSVMPSIRLAEGRGWLQVTPHRISATSRGRRFLNEVLALFLPVPAAKAGSGRSR